MLMVWLNERLVWGAVITTTDPPPPEAPSPPPPPHPSCKQLKTKAMGSASQKNQNARRVGDKLSNHLQAHPARWTAVRRDHSHSQDAQASIGNHFKDRRSLCAHGSSVRGVFNVASRMDPASLIEDRGPDFVV